MILNRSFQKLLQTGNGEKVGRPISKTRELIRIVIVISNLEFGGAQRQVVELANHIDKSKFKLTIVSLSDFVPLATDLEAGSTELIIVNKRAKYDISVIPRLAAVLKRAQADIVHGILFDAEIAARLAKLLANTSVMIGSERNCNYKIKRIQRVFYAITKRLQRICIANSFAGAQYNSKMLGYSSAHYRVVHNGVNMTAFSPGLSGSIRDRLGIQRDEKVVGVFGSLKHQKNQEMLFSAAASLFEKGLQFRILIVGDELHGGMHGSSAYSTYLRSLIVRLGIVDRCIFVGNQENVALFYRACTLTVLPSLFEGMPNVVLESLSCGIPVIATDVSDNRQLVPDGEVGYLVNVGDVQGLADRIELLLSDKESLERLSINAIDWIRLRYSVKIMAENMASVYESVLSESD